MSDPPGPSPSSSDPILFLNARVVDGSGAPSYKASVLVQACRIRAIVRSAADAGDHTPQEIGPPSQARVVDCQGGRWVLIPGMIDMHAHSDLSVLHTPSHLAKITQGVTTEVVGQDGISYAPVTDSTFPLIRAQIQGWNGNPGDNLRPQSSSSEEDRGQTGASTLPFEQSTTSNDEAFHTKHSKFWTWRSTKEYLATLDHHRTATNIAYLVPQGNLRMVVMGYSARPATPSEIEEMQSLLRHAMEEGAVGMSAGLTYVPGMYASDAELASLLRVVAAYGGYFCPHQRSYGHGALTAYAQMLELARETGVRLHLTHATLNFAENRGRAADFLELLSRARQDGAKVTLDTYPYTPGSTTLAALLPSWAAEGGKTLERLRDPDTVRDIQRGVESTGTDGCHGCTLEWDTIEISGVTNPALHGLVGKTIAQIAEEQTTHGDAIHPECVSLLSNPSQYATEPQRTLGTSRSKAFQVFLRLLLEDQLGTTILQHVGDEHNVRLIMQDPYHCGGSDGILVGAKPHPRAWGTFPRYLGHYGRDLPRGWVRNIYAPSDGTDTAPAPTAPPYGDDGMESLSEWETRECNSYDAPIGSDCHGHEEQECTRGKEDLRGQEGNGWNRTEPETIFERGLEEAVEHLTSRPAAVVGLRDRGLIREGFKADLVLLDPDTVLDRSTFAHPRRPASGIRFVLVNGHVALDEGNPTHARNGQTIRLRAASNGGWQAQ